MKKRVLSVILSLALVMPGTITPFAAEETASDYEELSEIRPSEEEPEADGFFLLDEEEEPDQDLTVITVEEEQPSGEDILFADEEEADSVLQVPSGGQEETGEESEEEKNPFSGEEEPQLLEIDSEDEEKDPKSEETISLSCTLVNPLYEDVITEEQIRAVEEEAPSAEETKDALGGLSVQLNAIRLNASGSGNVCATPEAAGSILRKGMKNRQKEIAVRYNTTDQYWATKEGMIDFAHRAQEAAFVHTGNPLEGDSLRWGYGPFHITLTGYSSSTGYYLTYTYTIGYYMDAEQEQALEAKETQVLGSLGLAPQTSYGKTKTIYGYICDHVTYDKENLEDEEYTLKYSPYAAMINGTAVCQGYAVLLYQMLLRAGVDTRLIAGQANSSRENHAWNIVGLYGQYYNADSTWDAGKDFSDYRFFLKNMNDFSSHYRFTNYTTDAFEAAYPMASESYVETEKDTQLQSGTLPETQLETSAPLKPGKVTVKQAAYNRYTHLTKTTEFTISASGLGTGKLTFKSSNGNVKVDGNGKVTIAKNFAGTAVITVTAAADKVYQQASAKVTVNVTRIKAPSIKSLKNSASKTMTVAWHRVVVSSGYQICYATDRSFTKDVKTVTVKGRASRSKKIGRLKKGKYYYVRVRAYKTSGGINYYSSWSKTKYVKIRK